MENQSNKPLFQNVDEQERIYAPEQVPGNIRDDLDDGGPAAEHPDDVSGTPIVPTAAPVNLTTPELTLGAPASVVEANTDDDRDDDRATA
jgi:hypothetical protein